MLMLLLKEAFYNGNIELTKKGLRGVSIGWLCKREGRSAEGKRVGHKLRNRLPALSMKESQN